MTINENNRVYIGIAMICVGLAGFFFFMSYLNMFGSKLDYVSPKNAVPFLCLLFGGYGIGYMESHKSGLIQAGVWALVFGAAWLLGYIMNVVLV